MKATSQTKGAYVKLERQNDWGHVYFARPGKGLSPTGTSDVRMCGLRFREGASVRVLWPDGSKTTERVVHRVHRDTIMDHGHSYDVEFSLAGFQCDVRGIKTWVPLDHVKIHTDDLPGKRRK